MTKRITFVVVLLAASAGPGAEAAKSVRGTRVVLTPPPGFVVAERFPGFQSEETGASLVVTELPAPFREASKGFNADGLKKNGMTLLSREEASFGNHHGVLLKVAQPFRGVDFRKWMGVFGDAKATYLVVASFPKEAEADVSEALKKSVIGARVGAVDANPLDALNFRVTPAHDMKIAKVAGNVMILTRGGVFPAKGHQTPLFVAGESASSGMAVPDKRAFALARLQKITALREVRAKSTKPITIGGLDGFESVADARHADSGADVLAYQVILFDEDGYYVMQGIGPAGEGEALLKTFRQLAGSFTKAEAQRLSASGGDAAPGATATKPTAPAEAAAKP